MDEANSPALSNSLRATTDSELWFQDQCERHPGWQGKRETHWPGLGPFILQKEHGVGDFDGSQQLWKEYWVSSLDSLPVVGMTQGR